MRRQGIVAFSSDPGGARCLLPVIHELEKVVPLVILGKNSGFEAFERAGCRAIYTENIESARKVFAGFGNSGIRLVLTSASSLPEEDMTEKHLWRWAEERAVPCMAVLDQWHNILRRFCIAGESRLLPSQPSYLAVMDEAVRMELISKGFPADRVVVTGQPYLEWFARVARLGEVEGRLQVRARMGLAPDETVVCFVAEPTSVPGLRPESGDDQMFLLRQIVSHFCGALQRGRIRLWLKLHPKNSLKEFNWVIGLAATQVPGAEIHVIGDTLSPEEVLWGTDLLVGMSSIMLIQAALLGRPVVSFQPQATSEGVDLCYLSQRRLIPRAQTAGAVIDLLELLLNDKQFAEGYISRQSAIDSHEGAARRIAGHCLELIGERARSLQ